MITNSSLSRAFNIEINKSSYQNTVLVNNYELNEYCARRPIAMAETHIPKFRRRTRKQYTTQVITKGLLLGLSVLLAIIVPATLAQEYASNEINTNQNKELTEVDGGEIVGERTLRLAESPFLLRSHLEVALGALLIVEPGVVVHLAPMVGITVRGALQAVVSAKNFEHNILFFIYVTRVTLVRLIQSNLSYLVIGSLLLITVRKLG